MRSTVDSEALTYREVWNVNPRPVVLPRPTKLFYVPHIQENFMYTVMTCGDTNERGQMEFR
jgi:hypothetical protein